MERKNALYKNVLLVMVALFFLGTGCFCVLQNSKNLQTAFASTQSTPVENTPLPDYFLRQELFDNNGAAKSGSLIDGGVFLFNKNAQSSQSHAQFSFLTNGKALDDGGEIYEFVYYPDENNTTAFQYYHFVNIRLTINGAEETLPANTKIESKNTFENATSSNPPQKFSLEIGKTSQAGQNENNRVSVLDTNGNVREGAWTLEISYFLYTCTDGGSTAQEEEIFESERMDISYTFYVLDEANYISSNKPVVKAAQFDSRVDINSTARQEGMFLYSHYASLPTTATGANTSSSATAANQIPYVEYDPTKFEASITRTFDGNRTTQQLLLDIDEAGQTSVQSVGSANVKTKHENNKLRMYFTDLGEYEITLSAITVVQFQVSEGSTQTRKYAVDTLSQNTKTVNVFMFGYQATYTDFDGTPDENNILPKQELKSCNLQNETFYQSADITSLLLNTTNFVKTNGGETDAEIDLKNTFAVANVASALNQTEGNAYKYTPVKTNQTPIILATNSSEAAGHTPLLLCTNQTAITPTASVAVQGQQYYSGTYSGGSVSAAGKYIFILPYTYQNYYVSEQLPQPTQVFYQVFFFEITANLSEISVTTVQENGLSKEVASNTFVNCDVCVKDTTKSVSDIYNRDVVVQIYAQDFAGNYLQSFNGTSGISLAQLANLNEEDLENEVVLSQNAHYTIRLYYQSTYFTTNTSITNPTGFFREQYFTIDKDTNFNISAQNYALIEGTDRFSYVSQLQTLFTNQSFALTWDAQKQSGAKTNAYYRFFPLVNANYYGNDEATTSEILSWMLTMNEGGAYMPINKVLNLDTTNNLWLPYGGVPANETSPNAGQVFSNAGLYLVDVWDEAGNRNVCAYVLDNSAPLFALQQGSTFKLSTPTQYISTTSTLYWGDFKTIYISKFDQNYYTLQQYTPQTLDSFKNTLAADSFYQDANGNLCTDIYVLLYNNFLQENFIRQLSPNKNKPNGTNALIESYDGLYLTIEIDDVSYYVDNQHQMETRQEGNSVTFDVDRQDENDLDSENTYTVYIRDASNTRFDSAVADQHAATHYRHYYSATQTIEVSFDASKFKIFFEENNEQQILHSNLSEIDAEQSTKTVYFTPLNLEKALCFDFVALVEEEGAENVAVESVTITYTPYELVSQPVEAEDGTIVGYKNFYQLSTDPSKKVSNTLYSYQSGQPTTQQIRLNGQNITTEGKYEITRTYRDGNGFTVKNKDYKIRTFVLYVDRFDVVTNGESAKGGLDDAENGEHLESLVGGDIFVSMFDTGRNTDLVVNFPNSESGNTDGVTLKNLLTTNKLPVNVYVPTFKYTIAAQKNALEENGMPTKNYDFEVENNQSMNNFREGLLLKDYVLFARIYRNNVLIGTTSPNAVIADENGNAVLNEQTTENGFLKFYQPNSTNALGALSVAGEYRVQILQGYFGRTTITSQTSATANDYTFEKEFSFTFTIANARPDFEVSANGPLNSSTSNEGGIQEFYYTNKSEITLSWDASPSKYMVEIDQNGQAMKFVAPLQDPIYAKDPQTGEYSNIWVSVPTSNGNTWTGVISLGALGVYSDGRYVDISMQFENYSDTQTYYSTVTKRVYVDLVAPDSNVEQLADAAVEQSEISALTKSNIRRYQRADRQPTSVENNRSYNLSAVNEPFAYYSYAVSKSYLATLKGSVDFATYVRKVDQKYASSQTAKETDPDDFRESNFENVFALDQFESDVYYEIVEADRAGNMSIYTVFVVDTQATDPQHSHNIISYTTAPNGEEPQQNAYTSEDFNLVKNSSHPGTKHNIYSKTQFTLNSLDFFGDEWAEFTLNTFDANGNQTERTYILNPYDKANAFLFNGQSYTRVAISDLIDGSFSNSQKRSITFKNRTFGATDKTETFYISIYNTSLAAHTTTQQTREYIRFDSASDNAIISATTATRYLTWVKISLNDSVIFEKGAFAQNPNPVNKLGFASDWQLSEAELAENNRVLVHVGQPIGGTVEIEFELNPIYSYTPNSRITYEFMDNFGEKYTELHLFRETIIEREVTSSSELYQYYNSDFERIFHITSGSLQYHYNPGKYSIKIFGLSSDLERIGDGNTVAGAQISSVAAATGVTTCTITSTTQQNYSNNFVIDVYSVDLSNTGTEEQLPIKSIYFTLYNKLPTPIYEQNPSTANTNSFYIIDANGTNITSRIIGASTTVNGYFSQIRVVYNTDDVGQNGALLPVKFSYSTDRMIWTELSSGEALANSSNELQTYYLKIWYDQQFLENYAENGNISGFVFQDLPSERIYAFNLSSQSTTFWVEVTRNGVTEIVRRSRNPFVAKNGQQYAYHYIINLPYTSSSAVQIQVNREQEITKTRRETFDDIGNGIVSELWLIQNSGVGNVPAFSTYIVITYVPPSDNIVDELFTFSQSEEIMDTDPESNLQNSLSTRFVVEQGSNLKQVEIQWSRYYGYTQNEINISIVKDNLQVLTPQIFQKTEDGKDYFYTYLTYSGIYRLTFTDEAGNVHRFNRSSVEATPYFVYEYLQDVPFTISYNHAISGQEIFTLPTKQAIYNGAVTLHLDKDTFNTLYTPDGRPRISVRKNGKEYVRDDFANVQTQYTFDEAGFYEVSFQATESQYAKQLKTQVYQFTILNPDENRISYVYNKYSNYYVKRVLKDGVDITRNLVAQANTLGVGTVSIPTRSASGTQNLEYLTSLPLAYNSSATGVGKYTITICSNNSLYESTTTSENGFADDNPITTWTFVVSIKKGTAPISVSVAEGKSTIKTITATFNQENIYSEMGECTIQIAKLNNNGTLSIMAGSTKISKESTGVASMSISSSGTYFIQVVSPSGNLLYSYKVIKKTPLNAASIIAIVISVLVVLVVVFIVFKLRKRISVK